MVCKPKEKGGLGIINLEIQSKALLLKHMHRFYNRHDIPWIKLIWSKYYRENIPHAAAECGSFWWKDIMRLVTDFRGVVAAQLGEGDTSLFFGKNYGMGVYFVMSTRGPFHMP